MSNDLIGVIEDLLEATDNAVNKKNLTTDGKSADSATVKPTSGKDSASVEADMKPHNQHGDNSGDVGSEKGKHYTGKGDNVGVSKSMDGDKTTVLDSGADKDVGKEKTGDHYKNGHPSDASGSVEADQGPHDQGKDPMVTTSKLKEEDEKDEDDDREEVEEKRNCSEDDAVNEPEMGMGKDYKMKDADNQDPEKQVKEEKDEDEDKEEMEEAAEGETLKTVKSSSNEKERPPEEKGDNMPETKQDPWAGHAPHNQAMDPMVTTSKLKEEDEMDDEDDKESMEEAAKKESVTIKTKDGEEVTVGDDDGGDKKDDKPKDKGDMDGDGKDEPDDKEYMDNKDKAIKKAEKEDDKEEVKEDLDEEAVLDEEFKEKAAIIFETAVNEKAGMIREELEAQYEARLTEEMDAINERVNEYVDYAVQEWIKENQLEIKYSLRTEIAENFIRNLKGLFEESYIEIPEEEVSVVDELTEAVESYKEQIEERNEQVASLQEEVLSFRRRSIVDTISEDLTQTQKIRLEKLSESVEADDVDEFRYKVEQLKESYFDGEAEQLHESFDDGVYGGVELQEDTGDSISHYAKFLSKTAQF